MTRPLVRRTDDRVLAGVLSGIAARFDWDPTLTRIGFVLLSALSAAFPGILVYIVLWIVMPREDAARGSY